jgi:hypothetical protein
MTAHAQQPAIRAKGGGFCAVQRNLEDPRRALAHAFMERPEHLPELLEALLEPEIARFLVYPRVCLRVRNHVCRRKPLFFA